MTNVEREVQERLYALQDHGYRDFHSRLIPNVEYERIIGVRTPQLRAYARELEKTPYTAEFMKNLPHTYYEENNLHACLIEQIMDYDTAVAALEDFLPFIDNWATCDMLRPKVFKNHLPRLLEQIKVWLCAEHPYTVRFGLEMLMVHFLDDDVFKPECLKLAAAADREEYYVRMMVAWFFATALAKQYEAALPYLEEHRLAIWVHNKTIQKAGESFRLTEKQKDELKKLKIK